MQAKVARYFDIAKKQSKLSDYYYKIGSVLVTKSGSSYKSYNKANKTHTQSNQKYSRIHAELDVLLKAGIHNKQKIDGSILFLYRETTHGLACSKPCEFCGKLLDQFNIKKIYYTDIDGYWVMDRAGKAEKLI